MEIAALISAAATSAGAIGSLTKGGKGKEIEPKQAMSPEMKKIEKFLMRYLQGNVGQTQYAPINPLSMGGADLASQFYLGQPYQHPAIQQYTNPMAMPGQPGPGGPGRQPPNPTGPAGQPVGSPFPSQGGRRLPPQLPGRGIGGGTTRPR